MARFATLFLKAWLFDYPLDQAFAMEQVSENLLEGLTGIWTIKPWIVSGHSVKIAPSKCAALTKSPQALIGAGGLNSNLKTKTI